MLASCSLQEIRQEDLAAILPDQQDCDAFGGFEYESRPDKPEPDVGDASGSDMELPTQLVNAAIQRVTESSSETESQPAAYASTLLQQFVQQQQLLNNAPPSMLSTEAEQQSGSSTVTENQSDGKNELKRKRGRPRKNNGKSDDAGSLNVEYCVEPNVSPDSGIQNSPDRSSSPEPNSPAKEAEVKGRKSDTKSGKLKPVQKTKVPETKTVQKTQKLALTCNNLDRVLYGNADRVLYPPRRKVGRPTVKLGAKKPPGRPAKTNEAESENVAPVNKNRPPVAKNATNQSETNKKVQTSKEDKKSKKSNKNVICDNEIVQLTSNTLSLSLKSSRSDDKPAKTKSSGAILNEICERVSKRLELNTLQPSAVNPLEENKSNVKKSVSKGVSYVRNKIKLNSLKSKFATLKHLKVMHTKHKHKKNKKHKIKILKTISMPSSVQKVDADIDKLIADFVRLCNLGTSKSQKENLPEVFRCVKRVSKKRKGVDSNDGRKKKKQTNTNSGENKEHNSNEQRLPLKKRHYHMSASNDSKHPAELTPTTPVKQETPAKDDEKLTKNGAINKTSDKSDQKVPTPVPPPESEDIVASHIDEAIEACINKYTHPKTEPNQTQVAAVPKTEVKTPFSSVTATTPKKRHRLEETKNEQLEKAAKKLDGALNNNVESPDENTKSSIESVVTELKNKKNLTVNQDKNMEAIAQMITRKKNRLEDLASNLVSKISPTAETKEPEKKPEKKPKEEKNAAAPNRASVIKSPIAKKIKPVSNEILDSVVNEKPTGIFLPSEDLELHIPSTTIQTVSSLSPKTEPNQHNLRKKKVAEEPKPKPEPVPEVEVDEKPKKLPKPAKEPIVQIEKMQLKPIVKEEKPAAVVAKKKIRRRKAINRTGFPTLKKKKKKVEKKSETPAENDNVYDRVPRLGEEASTFMKRTCQLSVVSLEKLQTKPESIPPVDDSVSKWEVYSECDSLPMDECNFPDVESVKTEGRSEGKSGMTLRVRDVSPATSTRSSERTKKRLHRDSSTGSVKTSSDVSEIDKKRKRDMSSEKLEKKQKKYKEDLASSIAYRKRLRDLSPTSSIEPLPSDKKLRNEDASSGDDSKKNKKVPRWRKKYLVAGLFSDYFKEDDETARAKRRESVSNKKLAYDPAEHPYGLLPQPYHCGKYLRCRKIPFQLPHDLWWQHTHAQLPGRDMVPSWNYRKIRTNVYCAKAPIGVCEPQACNCKGECEDDCINRLVLAECPSSHRCQNQKIQRHEWSPGLEKFMTDNKGWGVKTKLSIKKGEFILEYVGEVVSDQEFKHRMATRYTHDTHHYCLHLDGGLVIDGHRMGGDGRFVNHSCQPNCEMQKWSVNGQFRMALFALRDIKSGEELTYDYNFSLFNPAEGQVCKCGSLNCRGVIGGKSQRVKNHKHLEASETNNNHQPGRVGRPRKNQAKRTAGSQKETPQPVPPPVTAVPVVRPLSHQQKVFALDHHCFLLRNLNKVKRCRERPVIPVARPPIPVIENNQAFLSQLNALRQPRNMKTRRLAQAEENPELGKTARLAEVLKDLMKSVTTAKGP